MDRQTSFQQYIDPVGVALTTFHDVTLKHFGLEQLNSCLIPGRCPGEHRIPGRCPDVQGKQKWRRPAVRSAQSIGAYGILMLLLSEDVSLNTGPCNWKYHCGMCLKSVKCNPNGLQCDLCEPWTHMKCLPDAIHITEQEYARISPTDEN